MTPASTTADQTAAVLREYIGVLFELDDIVEVQLIHKPTGEVSQHWHAASDIVKYVGDIQQYNDRGFDVYIGVNPRKAKGTPGVIAKTCTPDKRCGGCNDCTAIARCLFADFDNDITPFEATVRIDEAGLPQATMLIQSGHGVHGYWKIESPMPDLDEWTLHQKGLIKLLGSDKTVHDRRRVMRLPPFTNHHKGTPAVCEIVEADAARVYPPDEFPKVEPKSKRTARRSGKADARERENAVNYLARLKVERADPYEDWYQVGMCLHSVDDGESMLTEWDRWSRSSPKWQDGICEQKWATFQSNGSLTIATLHQMANEDDPLPPRAKEAPAVAQTYTSTDPHTQQFSSFTPLDQANLPAMPNDLMPGWFGDMVRAVAASTEVDLAMPAMIGLAVLALACQRRFVVSVRAGHVEPTNIYTAAPAESGERKTGVFKPIILPIIKWEIHQRDEAEPLIKAAKSKRATLEQRVKELRKKAAKATSEDMDAIQAEIEQVEGDMPDIPTMPQLFGQDTTTEHLGTMMGDNDERMALLSDEGGMFDNLGGRYSQGVPNLDLFLQAHDGTPCRVDRGSRPSIRLNYPLLTVGILPQPEVIRSAFTKPGFEGRGLMSRFLYWTPRSALGIRTHQTEQIPGQVWGDYAEAIENLLRTPINGKDKHGFYTIGLSPDASDVLRAFVLDVEPMLLGVSGQLTASTSLKAWGSKLQGQVYRLAGIFHCVRFALEDGPERHSIEVAEAELAVRFARLLIPHAVEVFVGLGGDETTTLTKRVWAWVLRKGQQSFRERDAYNGCKTSKSPRMDDFSPTFDLLCANGYLTRERIKPGQLGGAPSVVYHVNPKATDYDSGT